MTHLHDEEQAGEVHIGGIQNTEAQADALNGRLRGNGFDMAPHSHAWTFQVTSLWDCSWKWRVETMQQP